METTITNYYLGYQQMHLTPPTTSFRAVNYGFDAAKPLTIKTETETLTRPKISFSIESIIGIKWNEMEINFINEFLLFAVVDKISIWWKTTISEEG